MPDDAVAYVLLGVDLLVVAAVLTVPLVVAWRLVVRTRGRATRTGRPAAVLRRCDACGVGWKGRPGDDASALVLKARRRKRRRTRAKEQDTPVWARRRGWSRCPSCLSTKVRTSSRQAS